MGIFDATLQVDCACSHGTAGQKLHERMPWLNARQFDSTTYGVGVEQGSPNVFVTSVPLNRVPSSPIVNQGQVPPTICLNALQPLVCLWAPAIRRFNSAKYQLTWISRILANSRAEHDHYRTLLHIAEFGNSLDTTLSPVRPLDPRAWAEEMPELYGSRPETGGIFLNIADNLSHVIGILQDFNRRWDPYTGGRPEFREAADSSVTFYKRLFLIFGLSHTALVQIYFQQHRSELISAYRSALRTPGCRPFAQDWLNLNGADKIGVRGGVRFQNPLDIPTFFDHNDTYPRPELFTLLFHIAFRASPDEIDHQFWNYDILDTQAPMLPPEVLMCGGRTI